MIAPYKIYKEVIDDLDFKENIDESYFQAIKETDIILEFNL